MGPSDNIYCIVLPRFDQTVFTKMMEGVFAACTERDYFPYIVVKPKESSTSEIMKKLEQLEHVDGILAVSFDDSSAVGMAVESLPMPIVVMKKN